jgi:pimeloyl-ACP methyl ester carboxylesterase
MTPKPAPKTRPAVNPRHSRPPAEPPPQVSGTWLLRALVISLVTAGVCAYLTLCLLFYQGQWQIVFHPSRTITSTPATVGLRFDEVRFDATESGQLQLDGWWIPADPASRYANSTLLFFHDGKGSLSDSVDELKTLHALGINLFAFDYRGFGLSQNTHPSEERIYQDADAAWNYLIDTRHLNPRTIVLYGKELGATIAAEIAVRHSSLPALILEDPAPTGLALIKSDPRTKLLPLRLLFHDRLELEPKLRDLKTPKLFLSVQTDSIDIPSIERTKAAYRSAAEPKEYFDLNTGFAGEGLPHYQESLRRFLDEHLTVP